jgi:hypothetical protein
LGEPPISGFSFHFEALLTRDASVPNSTGLHLYPDVWERDLAVFVLRPGDSGAMTVEEIFQLGLVVVFAAVLMATSQAFTHYRSSRHADVPALAVILRAERPTFLLFERVLVPREMSALIPAASDQPIDAVANGKDRKTCTSDRPGGCADVLF